MTRKRHKELTALIEQYVDDYDYDKGRTHIKVTLRLNGGTRKLSVSSSPSCPHAKNQFERDLKKAVKEMEDGLEPGTMWAKS